MEIQEYTANSLEIINDHINRHAIKKEKIINVLVMMVERLDYYGPGTGVKSFEKEYTLFCWN